MGESNNLEKYSKLVFNYFNKSKNLIDDIKSLHSDLFLIQELSDIDMPVTDDELIFLYKLLWNKNTSSLVELNVGVLYQLGLLNRANNDSNVGGTVNILIQRWKIKGLIEEKDQMYFPTAEANREIQKIHNKLNPELSKFHLFIKDFYKKRWGVIVGLMTLIGTIYAILAYHWS